MSNVYDLYIYVDYDPPVSQNLSINRRESKYFNRTTTEMSLITTNDVELFNNENLTFIFFPTTKTYFKVNIYFSIKTTQQIAIDNQTFSVFDLTIYMVQTPNTSVYDYSAITKICPTSLLILSSPIDEKKKEATSTVVVKEACNNKVSYVNLVNNTYERIEVNS